MKNDKDRKRDFLIAINGAHDVGRDAICRLGLEVARCADVDAVDSVVADRAGLSADTWARLAPRIVDAEPLAQRERTAAARLEATVVTLLDDDYPDVFRELDRPPPVLTIRGELPDRPGLSVVGSRRASPYGLEATRFFTAHAGRAGAAIVSGLALGVDGTAHQASVEVGAPTVAVMACGIDRVYPQRHRRLAEAIASNGAIVTELPVGTRPLPRLFPIRNRLIAALGLATLVIEATPRSGTLITARLALELGRDLFALPGRIFDQGSLGTNALIRDGAFPAMHPADLLRSLGIEERRPEPETATTAVPPLTPFAERLWTAMTPGNAVPAEFLATRLSSPVARVLATLLELELAGWVDRFPGPVFARRGEAS